MKSKLVCSVFFFATVILVTPAFGGSSTGDAIFPGDAAGNVGDIKLIFDHANNPVVTVPWFWHPSPDTGVVQNNVAGLKFKIKYDPYEVAIRGIRPASPDTTPIDSIGTMGPGFSGHIRHSGIQDHPESGPTDGPYPPNALPGVIVGTVWVPHQIANQSGIQVIPSHNVPFMSLDIHPRHTSNVRLNSDIDIRVSALTPIYHVGLEDLVHLNSVWIRRHVDETDPTFPNLPVSANVWEHHNSVLGFPIPNSVRYFRGPLPSTFSTNTDNPNFPKSGLHGAHIEQSDYIHVRDTQPGISITISGQHLDLFPSELYHVRPDPTGPNTIPLTSHSFATVVLRASDFVVGGPVSTSLSGLKHFGLGIDHIPEPASLSLLGLGAVAALMRLNIQRRRRRLA